MSEAHPIDPAATTVADAHGSSTEVVGPHGAGDHGEDHGHDDHAHVPAPLGPIDWTQWGAGLLGVIAGLVVALALALSTGFTFGA